MRLLNGSLKRLEDFAYAMTRSSDDACDLVAETVLRAYEAFGTLRDDQAFLGFLFTIAAREHRRRRLRARWFAPYEPEREERIGSAGPMPDIEADVRILYAAIQRLPLKQREAIVLFEISGFSLKEIREIQGGSISGIKVRLHRARRRLARLLGVPETAEPAARRSSGKGKTIALRRPVAFRIGMEMEEQR